MLFSLYSCLSVVLYLGNSFLRDHALPVALKDQTACRDCCGGIRMLKFEELGLTYRECSLCRSLSCKHLLITFSGIISPPWHHSFWSTYFLTAKCQPLLPGTANPSHNQFCRDLAQVHYLIHPAHLIIWPSWIYLDHSTLLYNDQSPSASTNSLSSCS